MSFAHVQAIVIKVNLRRGKYLFHTRHKAMTDCVSHFVSSDLRFPLLKKVFGSEQIKLTTESAGTTILDRKSQTHGCTVRQYPNLPQNTASVKSISHDKITKQCPEVIKMGNAKQKIPFSE